MALTREERKLLHQKSQQPTFGSGKPDSREGYDGDISFREVEGSGTVEYVKQNNNWVAVASSGEMPAIRIVGGGSGGSSGSGVTSHSELSGLGDDHHLQYLLIDGTRAMTGDLTINGGDIIYGNAQNATISVTPTAHNVAGKLLTITSSHTTAGTTNNIAGGALKFEAGQGKGSGAGGNIVFATANAGSSGSTLNALAVALTISDDLSSTFTGDVSVGDDLFLASSGSIVNWNSGDVTLTHAAGKLTFGGDGAVELDFNNHEMTNVDIDSGAIDGTAIGAASHSTIKGTTIDATTDFTIDGLIITADTISNDANLTIDVAADIILDAAGKDISLTDGSGTAEFIFNLEAAPELDVDGAFTIDGSSTIRLDSVSNMDFYVNGRELLKFDTNGHAYLHSYDLTLYNDYKINNKSNSYHYTSGVGDYNGNYSTLTQNIVSSAFNTSYGSAL